MAGPDSARPSALMLVLLVPVTLVVMGVLTWSDPGRVLIGRDATPGIELTFGGYGVIARDVEPGMVLTYGYGFPLNWLLQNAPFALPNELPLRDPREVETAVVWGPLVVNMVLVYVLLLAALWTARRVLWPSRRRTL